MVRYHFRQGDVLRTRFAIAPLMDLIGALYVLRRPDRYAAHRPWADWARPAHREPGPLAALRGGSVRHDVLARVRESTATDASGRDRRGARAGVGPRRLPRWPLSWRGPIPDGLPPTARPFLDEPAAAVERLVDQMRLVLGCRPGSLVEPDVGAARVGDRVARAAARGRGGAGGVRRPALDSDLGARDPVRPPDGQGAGRGGPRWSRAAPDPGRLHVAGGLAAHRSAMGPGARLSRLRKRRPVGPRRARRPRAGRAPRAPACTHPARACTARPRRSESPSAWE